MDQGSRVVDVTATRGKGGSLDEERWPPETMGEVRERELRRCLAILGVTEHYWLELPDIDMRSPLPRVGAPRVRALMDKVQPDTVLTFGPDGMTGHVGHKSVNRWVTDAFREVAPPGARLFYATQTPELQPNGCRSLSDMFLPGTPPVTPREELGICYTLSGYELDRKLRGIQEHASQIEGLRKVFGEDGLRRFMAEEYYRLAEVKEG